MWSSSLASSTRGLGCKGTEGEREGPRERTGLEDSPWLALVEGWVGGERGGLEDRPGLEDSPWLALVEGWVGGERGGLEDRTGLEDGPWLALAEVEWASVLVVQQAACSSGVSHYPHQYLFPD